MASQLGGVSLRNSCLAFIELNFNFLQRFCSLVDISSAYYAQDAFCRTVNLNGVRIIGRLECGRTQLEVSEELGIAQSVISRLWKRFQDDDSVSGCYSTGRPRVITPTEDRYLELTDKRNRWSTASDLSRQLCSATGTTVSRQTVYRRLGHIGLYARRSVRWVPLAATHCRLRLTWSREHALWTPRRWSCKMFSDESRFSLHLMFTGL
ncbi:transposable element Tcb1 transposase [Trichonephila clavipes]|nr:transposable element Tcb1 transposase [Trichonephila clavipes]